MSDKMRDEFEIAFAKKTAGLPTDEQTKEFDEIGGFESVLLEAMIEDRIGDTYRTNIFASAWWAWQASRSAVVIELPQIVGFEAAYDSLQDHELVPRMSDVEEADEIFGLVRSIEVREALDAAGVKYK